VLESKPKGGVQLTQWAHLNGSVVAFRPKALPTRDIGTRASYVLGRGYNHLFDLRKHVFDEPEWEQPFFCSEVLDEFFSREELGLPTTGNIYPDDLLKLDRNLAWTDVSDLYRNIIDRSDGLGDTPIFSSISAMAELSLIGVDLGVGRLHFDRPDFLASATDSLVADMHAKRDDAVLET
jgi:hypothetical protein